MAPAKKQDDSSGTNVQSAVYFPCTVSLCCIKCLVSLVNVRAVAGCIEQQCEDYPKR